MKYKCEKHKSNEGFTNEDGNWICWLCNINFPIPIAQEIYDTRTRTGNYNFEFIDEYTWDWEEHGEDITHEDSARLVRFYPRRSMTCSEVFTVIFRRILYYLDENGDVADDSIEIWKAWDFPDVVSAKEYFRKIKDEEIQVC